MLARTLTVSFLALASMAGIAKAEDIALARNSMRLFGGPSMDYPRIGLITWGQGLKVLGCQPDDGWCDVIADGQRGWVPSKKLVWPSSTDRKPLDNSPGKLHVTL